MVDEQYAERRAREDLGWYYAGLGPMLGLRAAPIEATGSQIYDSHASYMAHMHRRDGIHRAEVRRLAVVEGAMRKLPAMDRNGLRDIFTPFGAGRASYRLLTSLAWDGLPLVGYAIQLEEAIDLWRLRRPGKECTPVGMVALLEAEVSSLTRGNRIPSTHRLHRVWDAAVGGARQLVAAYNEAKASVLADQRAKRDADRDAELTMYVRLIQGEWVPR